MFSNIWISLGAGLLTLQSFIILNLETRYETAIFVFFATLFSYNFQRLTRHKKDIEHYDSDRVIWIKKNRAFLLSLTLVSGISTLGLTFLLNLNEIFFLVVPGIISVLYSLGSFGLRNVPSLKIVFISLVWTAAAVFSTIFISDTYQNLLIMTYVFLYIFSLCIPFDVRDLAIDDSAKKTIPQLFGIKPGIIISLVLFGLSQIVLFWITNSPWVIPISITGFILITLALKQRKELFYSGLIDGHIIFSSLIIFISCR